MAPGPLAEGVHAGYEEREEATGQSNCMTIDRISRGGGLCQRREEKQVGCRTEGWKYKGIVCDDCHDCQQRDGDEAIEENVAGPYDPGWPVFKQPTETELPHEVINVFASMLMR